MTIHYVEYGDKNDPLLIFLHGGGVSGWMWDKQVQYFSQYHCIVPDLPEQGQSTIGSNFSIQTSAEQLIELIKEKANGQKVSVIGFSLGAQITLQILSLEPDLVDHAMINSALVRPVPLAKQLIGPSIRLTFPLIKNKSFSKIQSKTLYIKEDYFDKYYKESSQMKVETLIRILEENMSFRLPKDFPKAKGKILVTVGDKEKSVMKKSAMDIVKSNPNCKGVILSNVGHGISLANPTYFNRMIEAWIQESNVPKEGIISM